MDISKIDYWATSGRSFVHRATVLSKVLATAFVISGVIVTSEPAVLMGLYALVLITVRAARLPVMKVMAISIFPGLFAILFALSHVEGGWTTPVIIIMKALTAASAMILLISTTQYTEVMGFFGRFLPRVVADGIFMTYRSFFILFDLLDHFLKALRLRGGFQARRIFKNAGNMASGLGMLFIHAYDKSQRLYDVMSIRGYSGRLATGRLHGGFALRDMPYLFMTAFFLCYAVYMKMHGLSPHGMFLPALLIIYFLGMEGVWVWKR